MVDIHSTLGESSAQVHPTCLKSRQEHLTLIAVAAQGKYGLKSVWKDPPDSLQRKCIKTVAHLSNCVRLLHPGCNTCTSRHDLCLCLIVIRWVKQV